ncbi:two component transcriptional regulator, winged helix family [Ruminiclostridium papyrosolvens DSM 2782]|uniref:Stage 0 sporulation protein A homolog n=1 Tax=Ruminiclostridium papyrosolvens DSM 2782 TaxID=588581 RepID=F1TFN5_9FIRM|nr:response regulator transcription factor [Ruminiclostridium papyrosolvens]EGD46767.1 two component transcriptional regulator, winged helix family [Ruminiclostridium papyrosolvens DSM 2782]WES34892.1 response regulator transcription factor [Ruminiclostridium papyrosolvens DSM 2782]
MHTIMLVEDDSALCSQIIEGLKKWGFNADSAVNFENIIDDFSKIKPQLVIMDINLPCYDGFYWCNRIREISKVPVIFLSSRDTNMDIIMAVNTGADDYIAKPFSMQILIAKIQAILRRTYDYTTADHDYIEHRALILNMGESSVIYGNSKSELTKNEMKILRLLMTNKGRIVSRESIMKLLWDDDQYVNDNTLTVNINRLRSRLSDLGLEDYIETKKGQGYIVI